MLSKKKVLTGITLVSSLSAVAQASSVVIGNWENQTDGWFDWPSDNGTTYSPPPTFPGGGEYTYSSIGATLGSTSLAVNPGGGGYTQSLAIKLEYVNDANGNSELTDFLRSTSFAIDETMVSSEWSPIANPDTDYAVTKLIINGPNIGFHDMGLPTTDTRNPGFPGGYTAGDFPGTTTGTLTWNYSSLLGTGAGELGSNPSYVELVFYTESNYSTVGNLYMDNARLIGPAVTATWSNLQGVNVDGTYHWSDSPNWTGGVPSSAGDSALFGPIIPGSETVTLNGNKSVGMLTINDGGPSYTIAQGTGGTLTIDNSGSAGEIDILSGSHTISAPVSLAANTNIAVGQAASVFTISGNIGGNGGITLTGTTSALSVGTTVLSGTNSYAGATTVNSGTLVVGGAHSLPTGNALSIGTATTNGLVQLASGTGVETLSSLTINAGSTLDITNNHFILDYGATDPAATIYTLLESGYNNGGATAWTGTGIDSSVAALPANSANYGVGFVDGKDGVPGATVTSGQILVAYALYGDVNLDGLVNATDFAIFGANFNSAVTGWDKGDFTYTGLINATDFALLGANFGKSASGASLSLPSSDFAALDAFAAANGLSLPSVPEPASVSLLLVSGAGMMARRRRRMD